MGVEPEKREGESPRPSAPISGPPPTLPGLDGPPSLSASSPPPPPPPPDPTLAASGPWAAGGSGARAAGADSAALPSLAPQGGQAHDGHAHDGMPTLPAGASFGRYRLERELGRGGMGLVFLAWDDELRRQVALKMLLPRAASDAVSVERFLREARAAGRLHHPGIVPVHDVGAFAGRPYFTMDYVAGESLDQALPRLAPRRFLEILRDVALALQAAHESGVVHRDVKPANVLLDEQDRPYLTDFGLAKEDAAANPALTVDGALLGTPHYMSPEQANGQADPVGPATDVWSLGVILYEHLAGRLPFLGGKTVEIAMNILAREPEPPSRAAAQLSPPRRVHRDLETICLTCLEKAPARRYPSAAAFAADLGHFLEGEPIHARPPSVAWRMRRWAGRRPGALAAVAVLVAAAAVLAVRAERYRSAGRLYSDAKSRLSAALALSPDQAQPAEWTRRVGEARLALDRVLAVDAAYAPCLYDRGLAREAVGDVAGAAEDFEAATRADPALSGAADALARCLARLPGRVDEARRLLTDRATRPGVDAALARARLALLDDRPATAVLAAREVLAAEPDRTEAFAVLSHAYRLEPENIDEVRALADMERAVALRPGDGAVYHARALLLARRLRPGEALADLERAAARGPSAELDEARADSLLRLKDIPGALVRADAALAAEPGRPKALALRGVALRRLGREAESVATLERLLELGSPDALRYASEHAERLSGLPLAPDRFAALVQALSPIGRGFRELVVLADLRLRVRGVPEAGPLTAELVRRFPDRPEAWLARGEFYSKTGRPRQAYDAADRAIRVDPEFPLAYHRRAQFLLMVFQFHPALADADRALVLAPAYLPALRMRGSLRLLTQRGKEAAADFAELAFLSDYAALETDVDSVLRGAKDFAGLQGIKQLLGPMLPRLRDEVGACLEDRGAAALASGDAESARRAFTYAMVTAPARVGPMVGLARMYTLKRDEGAAFEFLERAERAGWRDVDALATGPEWAILRETQRFSALLRRMREQAGTAGVETGKR